MGKVATGSEPRELIPAKVYYAFCSGMYDIGTQNGNFGLQAQFIATFELHSRRGPVRDKKGDVLEISAFLNFYLGNVKKKQPLCELAEACDRRTFFEDDIKKGYDPETAVGKLLKLKVIHKPNAAGTIAARIETFMAIDDDDFGANDAVPEPVANHHYYEIKKGDTSIPDYVPKFIKGYIEKSTEFGGASGQTDNRPAQPHQAPVQSQANRQTQPSQSSTVVVDDDEEIPF